MFNIDKIDSIPPSEREKIIKCIEYFETNSKFEIQHWEYLFKIYRKYLLRSFSSFSMSCGTCRMKVKNTFQNFADIWRANK
jgi:hypothetical protein